MASNVKAEKDCFEMGQKNNSCANLESKEQTKREEGTSSPDKKYQSEKTEKPSEETTNNQKQTEQQDESCTEDQDSNTENKLPGDKQLEQKNNSSAENRESENQTNTKDKISVVILGNEESLKKALITVILGTDLSDISKRKILKNTEIHEEEKFMFICTPDLRTPCDDITEFLSKNPHPDMCLLVVKKGFSTEQIWHQIDVLNEKTGKPTEEFVVVLPLGYEPKDFPFKSFTLEQLFNELDKVIELKQTTYTRSISSPQSEDQLDRIGNHIYTTVNLVLLGLAGTGKSASGNTILGKKHFVSNPSSNPVTTECQVAETDINSVHVRVIDTPDMFDDDTKPSVRDKHVKRCKELCESELCVFVLVMHVSRFTDGERDILKRLENAFGTKVKEQTVILFTRGENLEEAEMTLEDFLHSCQPGLKEIIEKCDNRCVLFENRSSSSDQVEKLMNTVSMVLKKTAKIQ